MRSVYYIAGFLVVLALGSTLLFSGVNMKETLAPYAKGSLKRLEGLEQPLDVSSLSMVDEAGNVYNLADFNKGKVTVLNIWATWCAPCLEEMPSLSRLQEQRGGDNFEVVIVSIDRKGFPIMNPWLEKLKVTNLRSFLDPKGALQMSFNSTLMPTTVFLNKKGEAVAKMIGPAPWDESEVAAVLDVITGAE